MDRDKYLSALAQTIGVNIAAHITFHSQELPDRRRTVQPDVFKAVGVGIGISLGLLMDDTAEARDWLVAVIDGGCRLGVEQRDALGEQVSAIVERVNTMNHQGASPEELAEAMQQKQGKTEQ